MARLKLATIERLRATGNLLGPKVNDALVTWARLDASDRENAIAHLEDHPTTATLLRAFGEALGLP